MSSTTNMLKRNNQDDASTSKRQKQEEYGAISVSNILDIPDGILREIILYLNARERVPLGHSCQKFNSLVFGDEELLRNLDFSKDAHLTSASDLRRYFNNENIYKHVLGLNVRNVDCVNTGRLLINFIGKVVNLVNINIHGIKFTDILQLGTFLNPLIHLQRLSLDWPEMKESHIPLCSQILHKPFGRLVYLSVKITIRLMKVFILSSRLFHELQELYMVVEELYGSHENTDIGQGETQELRNLQIVEYSGPIVIKIKELFVTVLPEPEKWTDFQLNGVGDPRGFHLEKNVEVCDELLASKWMEEVPNPSMRYFNLGWALFPECLLNEVLEVTHPNLSKEFCCLSTFMDGKRCLLTIEDAKRLLKNPRHQVSYLFINHEMDIGCDVHLVASAFSNLTELVLCAVTRNLEIPLGATYFQQCQRRRPGAAPEEPYEFLNLDSAFKTLVKNTPHLKHLTLGGSVSYENWDLDELYHISSWNSLETLRLYSIPINDGNFLIEIGKRCKNLRIFVLIGLGSSSASCYERELLEMLKHCKNLRDFAIQATKICEMSELFTTLANNAHLRKVVATNIVPRLSDNWTLSTIGANHHNAFLGDFYATNILPHLSDNRTLSIIRELVDKCCELNTIVCSFDESHRFSHHQLSLDLERLKNGISRPKLQIAVWFTDENCKRQKIGTFRNDTPHPAPFFRR